MLRRMVGGLHKRGYPDADTISELSAESDRPASVEDVTNDIVAVFRDLEAGAHRVRCAPTLDGPECRRIITPQ